MIIHFITGPIINGHHDLDADVNGGINGEVNLPDIDLKAPKVSETTCYILNTYVDNVTIALVTITFCILNIIMNCLCNLG